MAKVTLNTEKLTQSAKAAFKDACLLAHREMIQAISDPGAFPAFPGQDIVDEGVLRASQQPPEFSEDGAIATFRNTVAYAVWVALGYTLRNGGEQPGRNWMAMAFTRMDFEKTMMLLLKAKL